MVYEFISKRFIMFHCWRCQFIFSPLISMRDSWMSQFPDAQRSSRRCAWATCQSSAKSASSWCKARSGLQSFSLLLKVRSKLFQAHKLYIVNIINSSTETHNRNVQQKKSTMIFNQLRSRGANNLHCSESRNPQGAWKSSSWCPVGRPGGFGCTTFTFSKPSFEGCDVGNDKPHSKS